MALELFPTPSWPQPSFYFPCYDELKKFPDKERMAAKELSATEGAYEDKLISYWACDNHHLYIFIDLPPLPDKKSSSPLLSKIVLSVGHHRDCQDTVYHTTLAVVVSGTKPTVSCLYSYGTCLPSLDCSTVKVRLTSDGNNPILTLMIPWNLLPPVRPLLYDTIALNLSFLRRSGEERKLYQLQSDENYDSHEQNRRKLFPVGISTKLGNRPLAQSFLTCNLWRGDKPLQINLGLYNPLTCPAQLQLTIRDNSNNCLETHASTVELGSGCHHWTLHWSPQRPLASGKYLMEISGHGCGKSYLKKHDFYVVAAAEIESIKSDMVTLEETVNCLHPSAVYTTLAILENMEARCTLCTWDDISYQAFLEARSMRDSLLKGKNPLENITGLSHRAFRSQTNGELQTYSLVLPKGFGANRKWPLLLFLPGTCSQGQNIATMATLQKAVDRLGIILVIPSAKSLEDISQNLLAVKQSLPLNWDRLFIGGIGAGAFKTLAIGLRCSNRFSGLAFIFDHPCRPTDEFPLAPSEQSLLAANTPVLVLGTEDTEQVASWLTVEIEKYGIHPLRKTLTSDIQSEPHWIVELATWLKPLIK